MKTIFFYSQTGAKKKWIRVNDDWSVLADLVNKLKIQTTRSVLYY